MVEAASNPNTWEQVKLLLNYAIIPFVAFVLREVRLLAEAMHKLDVRLVRIETTVGLNRRSSDPHITPKEQH